MAYGRGRPKKENHVNVYDNILLELTRSLEYKINTEVTLKDIGRGAGVSEASVRHYFGTKDKLLNQLLKGAVEDSAQEIKNFFHSEFREGAPGYSIRELVRLLCELSYKHKATTRLYLSESLKEKSSIFDFDSEIYNYIHIALREICQDASGIGLFRKDIDADFFAFTLVCLSQIPLVHERYITSLSDNSRPFSLEQWIEIMCDMIDKYYLNDTPLQSENC